MSTEVLELLIATRNAKKLQEIKVLLKGLPLRITSLKDYRRLPEVIEDGLTFEENAIKKATTIARSTGKIVLGEDSGLEVAVLGNRPGVLSARYAAKGKAHATDIENNKKLLHALEGLPLAKRKARYRCCVALSDRNGLIGLACGSCSGIIAFEPKGRFGFGYDPLFLIKKRKKTFAQLGPQVKHGMSHRYKALKKARRIIGLYLKKHHQSS